MRMFVTKKFRFEAAHFLENYAGSCARMHGHSYVLEVTVGTYLKDRDMVIDFSALKGIVKALVIDRWDHQNLNSLPEFSGRRSTAENMVGEIVIQLLNCPALQGMLVYKVRLWETEDSYAEWINEIE